MVMKRRPECLACGSVLKERKLEAWVSRGVCTNAGADTLFLGERLTLRLRKRNIQFVININLECWNLSSSLGEMVVDHLSHLEEVLR